MIRVANKVQIEGYLRENNLELIRNDKQEEVIAVHSCRIGQREKCRANFMSADSTR